MTVFPLHHLHFPSIFLEGKNTKRGKKPKPPSELSKTPKLFFSFTFLLENSREQKCCFRRSHCSVGSSNSFTWHEEEWRGLKWELTYKDINSYPRFWVPARYTAGSASTPFSAALKRKCPTKIPAPRGGRWRLHQHHPALRNYCPGICLEHNEGRNLVHLSFHPTAFNTLQAEKFLSSHLSDVVTTTLVLHNK